MRRVTAATFQIIMTIALLQMEQSLLFKSSLLQQCVASYRQVQQGFSTSFAPASTDTNEVTVASAGHFWGSAAPHCRCSRAYCSFVQVPVLLCTETPRVGWRAVPALVCLGLHMGSNHAVAYSNIRGLSIYIQVHQIQWGAVWHAHCHTVFATSCGGPERGLSARHWCRCSHVRTPLLHAF